MNTMIEQPQKETTRAPAEPLPTVEAYALFKYTAAATDGRYISTRGGMFSFFVPIDACDCDEDDSCPQCAARKSQQSENATEPEKPKKVLSFVAMAATPAEIAAQVRKAPLEEYVVMRGHMHKVQVALPVFMDGRNLDTLSAEWSE